MGKPQIITSPSGEELVVVPRRDYEDLVDTAIARLSAIRRGFVDVVYGKGAARRCAFGDLLCVVRRTVVDDDYFERRGADRSVAFFRPEIPPE